MYCVVVYDVSGEGVVEVCHFLRRYMNWVQNSVFEGELTKSQFYVVKTKLKAMINPDTDSVLIYVFRSEKDVVREQLGTLKRNTGRII